MPSRDPRKLLFVVLEVIMPLRAALSASFCIIVNSVSVQGVFFRIRILQHCLVRYSTTSFPWSIINRFLHKELDFTKRGKCGNLSVLVLDSFCFYVWHPPDVQVGWLCLWRGSEECHRHWSVASTSRFNAGIELTWWCGQRSPLFIYIILSLIYIFCLCGWTYLTVLPFVSDAELSKEHTILSNYIYRINHPFWGHSPLELSLAEGKLICLNCFVICYRLPFLTSSLGQMCFPSQMALA